MASIRARLTLWYTACLCLILFAFGLGVLAMQQHFSGSQSDAELRTLADLAANVARQDLRSGHTLAHAADEVRRSVSVPGRMVALQDNSGRVLAAHWRGFPAWRLPSSTGRPSWATMTAEDRTVWRVYSRSVAAEPSFEIVTAAPKEQSIRERELLARALLTATPFALLFTGWICWWAASRALEPLTDMARQTEQITGTAPDARLFLHDTDDEVAQLARAFNRLLDRLGTAMHTQRQFMADASHELRTPISIARAAADVTLGRETRDEGEYREALGIIGEQTRRLGKIVDDMLVLARADAGGLPIRSEQVDLDDLVGETVHAMGLLAARDQIHIDVDLQPEVAALVDPALCRQMLTNLLDNAIKHSPPGSSVLVALRANGNRAVITIADQGSGIPKSEYARVFRRFVRLDPARDGRSGAGLGLPIARWIAESHGGTLTVDRSAMGGCIFSAELSVSGSFVNLRQHEHASLHT